VYNLVVYSQDQSPSTTWSGETVIQRFELTRYDNLSTLTPNVGYVDPAIAGSSVFTTWPFIPLAGSVCNLQNVTTPPSTTGCNTSLAGALSVTYAGAVDGNKVQNRVLTDFVDARLPSDLSNPTCPTGYNLTPRDSSGNALSRTFYACIRPATVVGQNQDVTIFLRGDAKGRSGITQDTNTAVLQTRVSLRGVLDKSP
jgi:hypothetical protein